jgi:hypothetical protein
MLADALARATVALAVVTAIAAVATSVAAIFTWRSARATRRAADATEKLATHAAEQTTAAERQALETGRLVEASVRPWLTAGFREPRVFPLVEESDDRFGGQHFGPLAELSLRNVGQGLALMVPEQCYMREYAPSLAAPTGFHRGLVKPAAVAPAEDASVVFDFRGSELMSPVVRELFAVDRTRDMKFLVDVKYTDAGGGQATWARLHVGRSQNGQVRVTRIDYLTDYDGSPVLPPFASSEFG